MQAEGPPISPPSLRLLDQRYEILEEVGRGGMAIVYRGRDRRLGGREVAVKVLHPHLASSPDARRRFKREADAAAQLEHENILKVFDASGIDAHDTYIVMEFVHGRTLREIIDARAFRVAEVGAMIAHEVAQGLAHAHQASIVHRDVKPENILVRDDGVVKLTDFGIARVADSQQMTITGALIGSPAHMSPEQIEGKAIDVRSDIFSLGILLYYGTTGVLPFQAPSPHAVLHKILVGRYEDPQRVNPAVGRRIAAIVARALERQPEDRYQTVFDLLTDLRVALAEVGLDDPGRELRAFFADPVPKEEELRERVVERLLALAERAVGSRRRATAIEHLNRVLCLDECNERGLELLTRLTRQRTWGRTAAGAGIVVAIAAVIAWAIAAPDPVQPLPPDARAVASLEGPLPPVSLGEPFVPPVEPLGVRRDLEAAERPVTLARADITTKFKPWATTQVKVVRDKTTPTVQQIAEVAMAAVPVAISAFPSAVRITVDGTFRGYGRTTGLKLAPGVHQVVLEHPQCEACLTTTYSLDVKPGKPVNPRFPIKFKPATLTVTANTFASVYVFGGVKGSTGKPIDIAMKSPEPTEVTVRVEAPGYEDASLRVALAAGETTARSVKLVPVEPPL